MSDFSQDRLRIGALIFDGIEQLDFTGPFEVLSRTPNSEFLIIARDLTPVKDMRGLLLTPTTTLSEAPQLDVLVVPGGSGVNPLMEDECTLTFLRRQAAGVRLLVSVCTGSFLLGAAGLLKGRRVTTHWASHHLLGLFGEIPVDERVVVDGNLICGAGVTSGIDAALRAVAFLRGQRAAEEIQLYLEYAPAPPFNSGSVHSAQAEVQSTVTACVRTTIEARAIIAKRVSRRLGEAGARIDSAR